MSGHDAGTSTAISLIVPVRDEEGSLAALVDSIRRQTRPPDEVLLVDGGSTDRTVALAGELTSGDARFRVIEAGDATPGRGRNVGASAARGGWLAFTDAGIVLEPTWLERLADAAASDPGVEVVYGNFEPMTRTRFERWAALTYPPPRQPRPGGRMRGPSVASMMIRREAFEAAGGFPDLRAAEDLIFMERVAEGGARVGWAPAATVWWQLQPTLGRTFRKFVLYSKHNVWAGRQASWHHGVARQYLAATAGVALAVAHHPAWAAVPAAGALARVARSVWVRREGRRLPRLLDPFQFLGVGMILLTIDAATFLGWAQAAARPRPRPVPQSAGFRGLDRGTGAEVLVAEET
jgi:GT2 family glycosyltransferase